MIKYYIVRICPTKLKPIHSEPFESPEDAKEFLENQKKKYGKLMQGGKFIIIQGVPWELKG